MSTATIWHIKLSDPLGNRKKNASYRSKAISDVFGKDELLDGSRMSLTHEQCQAMPGTFRDWFVKAGELGELKHPEYDSPSVLFKAGKTTVINLWLVGFTSLIP